MKLARINDDGTIDLVDCPVKDGKRLTELRNTGYLDFVEAEQPQDDAVESFDVDNGIIQQKWNIETS